MARHFPLGRPGRSRSRLVRALLAVSVATALALAMTSPSSADDKGHLKHKKHKVQHRINGAQSNLDQSSNRLQKTADALDRAQGRLSTAKNRLSETRGELAVARARDRRMQARLVKAQRSLSKAKASLQRGREHVRSAEDRVRTFTLERLQTGSPSMRALGDLLDGSNPMQFNQQMSISDSIGDAQLADLEDLRANKVMLEVKKDKVERLRDRVARQREAAARNLDRKQALETSAQKQKKKVADLVGVAASAKRKAASAKRADLHRLNALEAERDRISNKLKAIAAREAAQTSTSGSVSSGGDGGYLSYPAEGPITSPYGMRFHPILHVWKLHDGTDFGVPCGTPVHAAASGTVISEYFNAGYGNRIIISHGQVDGVSLATTYNHLSKFVASSGEHVSRGELIGYSGTTGYSTGCHLHFMVLENGNTVNPMGWL